MTSWGLRMCKTCKHWDQYKVGTWGGCVIVSGLLDVNLDDSVYDKETDDICTPIDFGCNRWADSEKKGEQS